jgi:hypothetical protein
LFDWVHDPADAITPGGRWDDQGAGFPFVRPDRSGGFEMYYAGWWGRSKAAAATRDHWRDVAAGMRGA